MKRPASLDLRLRLFRTMFTQRNVWPELTAIWRKDALFREIKSDLDPLNFARAVAGNDVIPNPPRFAEVLNSPDSFTPPELPAFYNSEPSVSYFLGQLVYYKKPAVVVELGCFVGWTTAHLALAMQATKQGHLYYLDYEPDHIKYTQANLTRLGLDGATTPLTGASLDPKVTCKIPDQIDVLFIDTSHVYPDTLDEILFYAPRMAPNGVMVLHDSLSFPGVRRAVSEVADKFRNMTFATEEGNGVTVLMAKDAGL